MTDTTKRAIGRPGLPAAVLAVVAILALTSFATPASAGCKYSAGKPRDITEAQAQKAVVCLVNELRVAKGRKPLTPHPELQRAARAHSRWMVEKACFAHTCTDSNEPGLRRRVTLAGYLPCGCSYKLGETIAFGHRSAARPRVIVKSWIASREHRRVLLTRDFREIGVGAYTGSPYGKSNARTYTADLGLRRR